MSASTRKNASRRLEPKTLRVEAQAGTGPHGAGADETADNRVSGAAHLQPGQDPAALHPATGHHWPIQDAGQLSRLEKALAAVFRPGPARGWREQHTVLDSFGWQIWHAGALLTRTGKTLLLHDGPRPERCSVTDGMRFWWQLPRGQVQSRLRSLLEFWSFNPVTRIDLTLERRAWRNRDEKIVVRSQTARQSATPRFCYFSLQALRGYEREFQQACAIATRLCGPPVEQFGLRALLLDQDIEPPRISNKPVFGLDEQELSETAVRRMALQMVRQARLFEAGIIDDVDTEFLHQYRVSLRKTRSLLNLLKPVFAPPTYRQLKASAGALVRPTGTLRDLDVFLLERERYAAMLPPGFEAGLEALFGAVQRDRDKTQAQLARHLRSARHAQMARQLEQTLDSAATLQSKAARRPVGALARQQILKHFHKLLKLGATIDGNTADAQVHELRIEAKKLRYLIEFFQELFERSALKPRLAELKALQDILGRFNDYTVQQAFLQDYAREGPVALAATVGGLTTVLHQQQRQARAQVQSAFSRFSSASNKKAFESLFGGADQPPGPG